MRKRGRSQKEHRRPRERLTITSTARASRLNKGVMKTRYAAALALVVWRLMIPSAGSNAILIAAPLSEWTLSSSYDSAESCESVLTALKTDAFTQAQYDCLSDRSRANLCHADVATTNSECVSTDDPRLKKE